MKSVRDEKEQKLGETNQRAKEEKAEQTLLTACTVNLPHLSLFSWWHAVSRRLEKYAHEAPSGQ